MIKVRQIFHASYQFEPAPYHLSKFLKLQFIMDLKIQKLKNKI